MEPIAHIRTPYAEKFGIPRQSNLAPHAVGEIVFTPPYRSADFVRGLEAFSHLWLIWQFHLNGESMRPTVRPPRLGGNTRLGVFATRSPFRPNGLGLSAVRLLEVLPGPVLRVSGADLADGTPIFDIKPYLPYADCLTDATEGFAAPPGERLEAESDVPLPGDEAWQAALRETLAQDPRPAYQDDPDRCYHLILKPYEIDFRVQNRTARILSIRPYHD